MIIKEEDYLQHYGTPRHSGRYPWGSGEDPHQSHATFLDHVESLRKSGMSEVEIAKGLDITTTQLRARKSIAKNAERQAKIDMAQRLKDKGYSNSAVGQKMGINESSVRALLAPGQKDRADVLQTTASMLRDQVAQKGYIDIGAGVENHLGISQTKLSTAVAVLKEEGYTLHYIPVEQQFGAGKTTIKVLAPPETPYTEVYRNRDKIQQITDFSEDGGRSFLGLQPPLSIDSKRIGVTYGKEGEKADGVIYVRPGVDDISLGAGRYAQVRIMVDGTHYLKGMAMYKDDLPDGVDLMFNTPKSDTGHKLDAMKSIKDDPDNPFGAIVRQRIDPVTKKVTSVMNIVGSPTKEGSGEEGSWGTWSRSLSSQFLSKQSPTLAKGQLDMTYERKRNELDSILQLTNPAVRKKLLDSYADDAESSAVHLKAAALPRQENKVLLPISSMKENEVYAPTFNNGERVVLVRFPHGGTFEIPELIVNNRNAEARRLLGTKPEDAIGINHKVAKRLSGADFDGDTVLVIPNNNGRVKTSSPLEGLKDFNAQREYPGYEGMPKMSSRTKQIQMGDVSNLITDMTIKGANTSELARAVRHSMVVIDAEKHNLDYKLSAERNGIKQLKEKYQGGARAGASTLISRKKQTEDIPDRKARSAKDGGAIDIKTGKKMFTPTGETYVDRKTGKTVTKMIKVKKILNRDDVNELSSGQPIEKIYADHSNRLKALANTARREMVLTKPIPYSKSAKEAYSEEVKSLNAKLSIALRNRPLERQAQLLASTIVEAKKQAHPEMDPSDLKKIKSQALNEARRRTGAGKERVDITDSEWKAIQAGAISNNKLESILSNADLDRVKQLATPKTPILMTSTKQSRARTMLDSGYTQAEVAEALGVSVTTLKNGLK